MADFPDKPPATWDELYEVMLIGSVGNRIVREVNKLASKRGYANSDVFMKINMNSVEKVYGVVLNEIKIPTTGIGNEWKLVKVGMTGKPTIKKTNNRMEQLISAIGAESSVLFKLPKGFYDTTSNIFEVEERVRDHMGFSVNKEVIKKMNLPCSTEWILTSQRDINELVRKIKEKKDAGEWSTTQIFKKLPKAAWNYWKMKLPDGLALDTERKKIVLSSPGQLPDWLHKELDRYGTRAGEEVSKYPPSPKEAVTGASTTGRKTASPEDTGTQKAIPSSPEGTNTERGKKGKGKQTTPSLPEEASTESGPNVIRKKITSSTPKGTSRESGPKVPRKKATPSTPEENSTESGPKGTRKKAIPSSPEGSSTESGSKGTGKQTTSSLSEEGSTESGNKVTRKKTNLLTPRK